MVSIKGEARVVDEETQEPIDKVLGIQAKNETKSGTRNEANDSSPFEPSISDNYAQITTDYLPPINTLPAELLTHIIFLAGLPQSQIAIRHPYLLFTWVCRHWRSILIQNPIFWTTIRIMFMGRRKDKFIHPFVHELLRRTKSSKLDILLSSIDGPLPSVFKDIFLKESDRIRTLWAGAVEDADLKRLVTGRRFPSLRAISYNGGLKVLLPILLSSDNLETLEFAFFDDNLANNLKNQLASVLNRVTNLDLTIHQPFNIFLSVLRALHNNANLQNMRLRLPVGGPYPNTIPNQIILPELQFLSTSDTIMEHILAPKLSSLDIICDSVIERVPKTFNFSSIKYLYILDPSDRSGYSIIGFKGVEGLISTEIVEYVEDPFCVYDFISNPFPRNCFHFQFWSSEKFAETLEAGLCSLISQMKNVTELYLLSPNTLIEYDGTFNEILSQAPSVEKLVIQYNDIPTLMDFIRSLGITSLCPKLRHLSFVINPRVTLSRKDFENYAEDMINTLTECLQTRQKVYGNELQNVIMDYNPSLQLSHTEKLPTLGATITFTTKYDEIAVENEYLDIGDASSEMIKLWLD